MTCLEILFWVCAGLVWYPYAIYPLGLGLLGRARGRPDRTPLSGPTSVALPSVSIVMAAYNEEATIGRRVEEFARRLSALGATGEVIVVSDGSTDATAERAREARRSSELAGVDLLVIDLPENVGKAAALTRGCASARHEIVAFADARQSWAPDALERLLEDFADPEIGAVSGELVAESAPGVMAGVGLYWRYEKWIRLQEGRVASVVGVTGAISAVRRHLFRPIPPGTILDDVYWPLRVTMQGYRVVHDARARAYDRLPDRARDEFRRKVRTLSGNFQLLQRLPSALRPGRNPVLVQFLSHKVLRLAVPWALLVLLILGVLLDGPFYRAAFGVQVGFYAVGLAGLSRGIGRRSRLASAAASFLVLNAAAWVAFWVWATGRTDRAWSKVVYTWTSPVGVAR